MQRMLAMHTAMKASIIAGASKTHHVGQSLAPMAQLSFDGTVPEWRIAPGAH
jgi:hypothetical protein